MKKLSLIILFFLSLTGCTNDRKEYVDRLNQLIGTNFDYKDERIILEQNQDFSSLITSITIDLSPQEIQQILKNNKHLFKYYETKVDTLILKGFSYDIEYDQLRESININLKKGSNVLNYTSYKN